MASRTRSLSKSSRAKAKLSKKAQFFILSAFAIVSIIYIVSRWVEPYTIPDTSAAVLMEEPFIFNNVKEKAIAVVELSAECEDLNYNLQEYKQFVERYALEKNLRLDFDYASTPCIEDLPAVIDFRLKLISGRMTLTGNFSATSP